MKRFDDVLVVTDLDGTLYENQNDIPAVNINTINRFIECGGQFAVSTGRGISASRFVDGLVPVSCPVIVNNGHTLYDFKQNKIIFTEYLPEICKSIVDLAIQKFATLGIEVYSDEQIFVLRMNEIIRQHLEYERVDYTLCQLADVANLPWSKVLFTDQAQRLKPVHQFVTEQPHPGLGYVDTSAYYLEILKEGVNKGSALLKLADTLQIPKHNTYAIGNYYNDLEMIQAAYIGAVVPEAPADLRDCAKYICNHTAQEGAVAEFLEYIMCK